ncbi:MAG: Uma2 family endonuclease [Pseudomonadota bacterium]
MAHAPQPLMTVDEFLIWCLDQEERYELVDGVPVLRDYCETTGQAGATSRHDAIVINIIIALGNQLGDQPCRVATGDIAVRTRIDQTRRPDVHVTCDAVDESSMETNDVKLIVEVLSPSNKGNSWHQKLDAYFRRDDLRYLLLVEQTPVSALLYTRGGQTWNQPIGFKSRNDTIDLSDIGCTLALAHVYDRIGDPSPR